ncbi:MAG: NAD(P)-dependent oxidoreductase [Actinomycetota bacterium]|nr:NAD(P)-dependent oxidoreductase [Actinomycetota bacterium]
MTSVLVTGGAGFTGRHIIHALADAGHAVVSYNRDFLEAPRPDVVAAQGELFDIPRLLAVMSEHRIDVVVHTAAMSHPTYSLSFPLATFAANSEGTVSLFEACRLQGVSRIVNFSSETVYGKNASPIIDEAQPVNPSTPYAVTKVTGEWLGRVYADRFGIDVLSLRIAQVYGPGNRMDEIVRDVMRGVVHDGSFSIGHGGDHHYNLIYVRDVAAAALAAVEAPAVPDRPLAYNISSSEYWSLSGIAEEVRRAHPAATVEVGPGLEPTLDLQGQFSIESARADFGYEPRWPLRRALGDYGAWLGDHDY